MGEVLKTGLIRDEKFYIWTINHMSEIEERIEPVLTKMIQKCCDIKRQVVENDPTEQGERAVLNLGTIRSVMPLKSSKTSNCSMASALHLEPLLLPIFPTREVISPMKSFTRFVI